MALLCLPLYIDAKGNLMKVLDKEVPTVESVIDDAQTCTVINETFDNSLIPLLLLTRERLMDFPSIKQRRISYIKKCLAAVGLQMRDFTENILRYTDKLFNGTENAPINILQISVAIANTTSFSDYLPLNIIRRLNQLKPSMKIKELVALSRDELYALFWDRTAYETDEVMTMLDELERRLREWNLSLADNAK